MFIILEVFVDIGNIWVDFFINLEVIGNGSSGVIDLEFVNISEVVGG